MASGGPGCLDDIKTSLELIGTKPLLKDLFNLLTPDYAIHWRTIGTKLGIRSGILDVIDYNKKHNAEDSCNAMWEEWLNIDPSAAWCKVIKVINLVKEEVDSAILDSSDQLQQFYKNERYKNTEDDWPPYQPDHFTSVALIHHIERHTTVRTNIAIVSKTHEGNIMGAFKDATLNRNSKGVRQSSDIVNVELQDQQSRDIAELFAPLQNSDQTNTASYFILIEGAPGIGKTILSKEITFQWANRKILVDKHLLFLIFLRDPYIQYITSLKDFVSYAICTSRENRHIELITEYLENTSGKNITVVLDGYDEMSKELRNNSFIAHIIKRKVLKLCGLVITSRPAASADLHGMCDYRIEILGFTKQDRMQYIRQSLQNNSIKIAQIENYLERNRFIDSLCYIPLNMTILMCLFKETSENTDSVLPKNQTDINDQFVCITISRYLRKKKNIPLNIKSLENLPAPFKQQLINLSRLAFDLLGKEKIVFNNDDIKQYSNWSDMGLLNIVKFSDFLKATPVESFNFLHFSLQEFLAGYYVASLSFFTQVRILKDKFWNRTYLNSWVMYAGLTKGNSLALKHLLTGHMFVLHSLIFRPRSIATNILNDKVKCLHLFQCFLEAGDDAMSQQVGNSLSNQDINLSNTVLLPKDMHTICFFLARSTTRQWNQLDLSNCYIGDDGCSTLANLLLGDDKAIVHINKLNLSSNHLTSRSIPIFLNLVQYFNVEELVVTDNCFDSQMVFDALFTKLIQHHLIYEKLLFIKTSEDSLSVYAVNCKNYSFFASRIQKFFQSTSTTYNLYFWNTDFIIDDLLRLVSKIDVQSEIKVDVYKEDLNSCIRDIKSQFEKALDMVQNPIHIFKNISYILVSETQMVAHNAVHNHIVQVIEHVCKPLISVLNYNLTACELSGESLCTIANILSVDFQNLNCINLSNCNMKDVQCKQFCITLFSSGSKVKYLKEFDLSHNKLTDACVSSIITSLKYCLVEKLNISCNDILVSTFHDTFMNFYEKVKFNSSSKVRVLVINSLYNERTGTLKLNSYKEVYITQHTNTDVSDMFDILLTSDNCQFLRRVLFFDCSSLLIENFDAISSLVKCQIKIEIQENKISDLTASEFLRRFHENCLYHRNIRYVLIAETNMFAYNHNFEKIPMLLLCDNSKVTIQLKHCQVPKITIPRILSNLKFVERLQLVDLSGCNIGDNGCAIFCNVMSSCVTSGTAAYLDELNLSNNCLTLYAVDHITHLLQVCTINKLILCDNNVDAEKFNKLYFKNKYDAYHNFSSNVPLIVFNNETTEHQHQQDLKQLHFTIYFLSIVPLIEDLSSTLSMIACNEHRGWIFIVDTKIQMDCFDKIMKLLLDNDMINLTLIEKDLKDDIAVKLMTQLKALQFIRYSDNGDSDSIQYLLLSNNNCLANNINHIVVAEILGYREFLGDVDHNLFFSMSIPLNTFICKHWESINLTNCNIRDNGCTILLAYFTPPEYTNTINLLNLSSNNLSSDSANTIAKLIMYSELKTLFISHNEVKEIEIANAVCKLQSESSKTNVPLVQIFKNHCVALIIHNLFISSINRLTNYKSCNVTFLSLENCYLNNEEHHTTDLISANELKLSQRILEELEFEYNVEDLEENGKIEKFIIKNSNITHKAALLLASKVLKSTSLTHMEISDCKLEEKGLFTIVSTIEETSSLQVLNLKTNFINDSLASKIASIISKSSQLGILNLSECSLQEDGMTSILNASINLSSLRHINFSCIKNHHFVNDPNDFLQSLGQKSIVFSFNLLPSVISNNQNLEFINISNCQVTEDDFANIMKTISLLNSLQYLDISGNTVTDIVADCVACAIRSNRDLEYLSLSNCSISEKGLFAIFNALSDLSSLLHIDVSLNRIFKTAAEEILNVFSLNRKLTHINLRQCDLDANDFVQIMSSVRKNGFLTFLDVSHNQVNQRIASCISTVLINNPLLEYLNFSFCKLTEDSIMLFADCLKKLCNLKQFSISHNSMSYSSAKVIALAIVSNVHIEYLDLAECQFVDFSVTDISLKQNFMLKSLSLKSNVIFINRTSLQVTDPTEGSGSRLQHLDLSHCVLPKLEVANIANKLLLVSTLKCIDISHIALSNDASTEIAFVICCNPFLEKLNLSSCELLGSQIANIVKVLKSLSRLKHLDISHNKVTDKAATDLAIALTANPLLEHLNLSNCELSDLHITSIAKALSEKESFLTFFDISHNKVTGKISDKIAAVITCNPLLEHLNLANCELQMVSISKALRKTSLLQVLDISYNKVTKEAESEIAEVILNNKSLQHLNLSACNFEEDTLMLIAKSLARINSLVTPDVSYI